MGSEAYLEINPDQVSDFVESASNQPVVMLNLVKYKALVPDKGISGKEAYKEYMRQAMFPLYHISRS